MPLRTLPQGRIRVSSRLRSLAALACPPMRRSNARVRRPFARTSGQIHLYNAATLGRPHVNREWFGGRRPAASTDQAFQVPLCRHNVGGLLRAGVLAVDRDRAIVTDFLEACEEAREIHFALSHGPCLA